MSETNGGDEMQFPRKGPIEWNLNTIVLIGGLAISFGVQMFLGGMAYNSVVNKQDSLQAQITDERLAREKRSVSTDGRLSAIEQKIPEITRLDDKITRLTELIAQASKANEETNKRLDRIIDAQNGKLDTIITRQSDQSADIKVIQSQLRETKQLDRTRFIPNPTVRTR